jgi:hypothetical protein
MDVYDIALESAANRKGWRLESLRVKREDMMLVAPATGWALIINAAGNLGVAINKEYRLFIRVPMPQIGRGCNREYIAITYRNHLRNAFNVPL